MGVAVARMKNHTTAVQQGAHMVEALAFMRGYDGSSS